MKTEILMHLQTFFDIQIKQLQQYILEVIKEINWTASSEFGTYRLFEQRRFRRACASAQSRQNLRCLLIQAVNQEEPSDRKPDPWPLWMAGHAQLKSVMTECSKTQIRLTGLNCNFLIFIKVCDAGVRVTLHRTHCVYTLMNVRTILKFISYIYIYFRNISHLLKWAGSEGVLN